MVTEANEKEIFPILTPEQVGRIAPFAREKSFEDGASSGTGASEQLDVRGGRGEIAIVWARTSS